MKIMLIEPELLNFISATGEKYVGGSQNWYTHRWHKKAGCGPVAAANLIWYMFRMQGGKDNYTALMDEMFTFLTPGVGGINTAALFSNGIKRYCTAHGLQFTFSELRVCRKITCHFPLSFCRHAARQSLERPQALLRLCRTT